MAFDRVPEALSQFLARPPSRRGNTLFCGVASENVVGVAELLCARLGADLILMVANDRRRDLRSFEVHYLFARAREDWFVHATCLLAPGSNRLPSLAKFHFPASRFEREIYDLFGIEAVGHPDARPLVRHAFWPEDYFPLLKDSVAPIDFEDDGTPFPFKAVGGEGIYEIPVGPVHAGIIEPGHFRFSVQGETVLRLAVRLYFTHKGTEKLFEGRLPADGVELAERISGDTTVGHSLAYCQALESLAGAAVPPRARYMRVVLLELERLYNHVADFGAICNDTGFPAAHAHCLRIREQLLRLNKRITGNRLLRGGVVPGGVACALPADLDLGSEVARLVADFDEIVQISLRNTILVDRLEGTGQLDRKTAADYGTLGYVARASGIDADARRDHPFAAYGDLSFAVPVLDSGDVHARAIVRVLEASASVELIHQAVAAMPAGPLSAPLGPLPPFTPAFGLAEGWRGTIVHWVMAGGDGSLYRVKVKDPSFVNWPALSLAIPNNIVPDFPLCNKSFNQSYSGNDL